MGILSLATEFIFGFIALAAFVLLIVFWNKFSRENFRFIAARVSIIVFINVFVLATIGIAVNRYGDFYATWSDLFGIKQNYAAVALAPKNVSLITPEEVAKADRTPDGALIFKKVITGEKSRISDYVYVVASPTLAKAMMAGQGLGAFPNYQVEELFSGFPGVPQTWIGSLDGIHTLSLLDKQGKIPPTLAIIPSINVVPRTDTECLDIPKIGDVETWLTADMFTFMHSFVGIDSRPWNVFGYSTGGRCAAEVAVRHPDLYRNAVVLAGYFQPQISLKISNQDKANLMQKYDIVNTAKSRFSNPPILIIYSSQDRYSFNQMKIFTSAVKGYLATPIITIPQGGHNIQVWKPYVGSGFIWAATGIRRLN